MPTKVVMAEEPAVVLQQEDMRLPATAAVAAAKVTVVVARVTAAVLRIQPQRHKEVLMALNMEPTVGLQMLIR
jgi:excinuclease UvrABC helicase subunit UvrB